MHETFGQWLRRQIDDRLMTLSDFAVSTGVCRSTLGYWLRDEQVPRGFNIVRLAMALGVSRSMIDEKISETIAA